MNSIRGASGCCFTWTGNWRSRRQPESRRIWGPAGRAAPMSARSKKLSPTLWSLLGQCWPRALVLRQIAGVDSMGRCDKLSPKAVEGRCSLSCLVHSAGSFPGRAILSCRAPESGLPWFGRSPGAQISLVARSGENRFHSVAYDHFSNDALNANDFFNNINRIKKQPLRDNNFGGIFSGLIQLQKKVFGPLGYDGPDHTFFFS